MANPRQRRKARSASHSAVKLSRRSASRHLKKHPPIKGPKVLQDAWDSHKTVRQNYASLGLAHTLSPNDSGGRDITQHAGMCSGGSASLEMVASGEVAGAGAGGGKGTGSSTSTSAEVPVRDGSNVAGKQTPQLRRGYGRIVRDASGNVVDVQLGGEEEEGSVDRAGGGDVALAQGNNVVEDDEDGGITGRAFGQRESTGWLLGNKSGGGSAEAGTATEVVRALEVVSKEAAERGGRLRTSSIAEVKYLRGLVDVHGKDWDAMARDVRRNRMQYTAGQLRRAIVKAGL